MPSALPAMRGKFGSTEYYLVTLPAKELSERLTIPKDMPGWDDLTVEEAFQREINYARVRDHVAPYLANDPDRFFGAFIVDIYNGDEVQFESIDNMVKGLPALYQHAAKQFGFLHFRGDEVLVPLDGQHRLAAIKFAITGRDQTGKAISGMEQNLEVASDICTVILVKHDRVKARKIFNKVNRYAKPTSKANNLITADDDIVAVITRDIADSLLAQRIVNHSSNTLSLKSPEFTTLSVLYDATMDLLSELHGKIDTTVLPSAANQKLYAKNAREFWEKLVQRVDLFELAVRDPSESGDAKRVEIRKDHVLGKPIIQHALVGAILRLQLPGEGGERLSDDDLFQRINSVDWSVTAAMWQGVLMNGDRVVTGKQARAFATRFIAYLLGEKLTTKELTVLGEQYANGPGAAGKKLPKPLF